MEQQQNVDLTIINLPPADRAAIVLDSSTTEKKLREMVASSAGILTVIDKAGREEAHGAAMALRGVRTTIAKTGKAAREDAQAFAKAVISEEARLIGIVQPEEDRVLCLRDGYDAKIAAEKAEIARKEAERKAGLQSKVDAIRNLPLGMGDETAAEIDTEIEALQQFVPGEDFMEYADAARDAAQAAISAMTVLRDRQAAKEAAAAELERQRAENERIAAEQEVERQRLAAVAAEQAAALKAEQDRFAAEQKAAADRAAAEQAAITADRAALQAERDALAAEKLAAQQAQENPGQAAADQMRDIFKLDTQHQPEEVAALAAAGAEPLKLNVINGDLSAPIAQEDADISECGELIPVEEKTASPLVSVIKQVADMARLAVDLAEANNMVLRVYQQPRTIGEGIETVVHVVANEDAV